MLNLFFKKISMSKNSALSESVFKLNNLNSEIEKMRLLSTKEKEDMEAQYKTEIISLKYLHEKVFLKKLNKILI